MTDEPTPDPIAQAVAHGIATAVASPATWQAGFEALAKYAQERAQREAGNWLFRGLRLVIGKALGFAFLFLALYYLGGVTAVLAYLKVKA